MELPLVLRFGTARMLLRDVLQLGAGSVIDLGTEPENGVDLLVNGRLVARGAAVSVHGNYGVRITEIVGTAQELTPIVSHTRPLGEI